MSYYKLYRDKAEGKAVRGTLYMCQPGKLGETLLVKAASTLENAAKMDDSLLFAVQQIGPQMRNKNNLCWNA